MPHVVDTQRLIAENILTEAQGAEIARRSRETMVSLVVNVVLCVGIVAATLGLVFWLADALAVAVAGAVFIAAGAFVLLRGGELYRMLGNAAALVGAGMLVAGGGIELVDKFRDVAGWLMLGLGALLAAGAYGVFARTTVLRFAAGAVLLMGVALHLWGLGLAAEDVTGLPRALLLGYAAALVAGAGALVDVRFVTALAIVPFAQMLDTGTGYFHAAYFFYSPESTLTNGMEWSDYQAAIDAWEAQFLHISEHVFTVVWAVLLAGGAFWAAHANQRGLFNAAITFGAIHAYTQLFETMSDEPLAWALGGLAAIPLAWGMWRLNAWLALRGDGNGTQSAASRA